MAQGLHLSLHLGLNTMIFQHVYWYMQQISGERLQDHWSSCLQFELSHFWTFLHLESDLPVGGIVFHKHMTWFKCSD